VPEEARARNLVTIDATCPLVTKVHREAQAHFKRGRHVVLVGHAGHPEVVGTMGQLPPGAVTLVGDVAEVERLEFPDERELAYVTQTTLSVDDTREVVAALLRRFPAMRAPPQEDICYATTNRQEAVKALAEGCDLVLVVGSCASSNSQRLVEVARRAGARDARLIEDAAGMTDAMLDGVRRLGLTAGASAPENLVRGVLDALKHRFEVLIEDGPEQIEDVTFKLPRLLARHTA
jgi:4-hydroxy-3-methylbut-2-enyl diphosphate reductase